MTGTEAISNAVPAFKPPESKNASITLGIMAAILGFLLLGVTGSRPGAARGASGGGHGPRPDRPRGLRGGFFYYALQIATMAILVLAANTSFTGFPRLASVLARDGLMPRQFMNRGDKLVFSNGIVGLTVAAIVDPRDLPGQDPQPHPALRGGRVHQLHPVAVGHGGPLVQAADARLAAARRS